MLILSVRVQSTGAKSFSIHDRSASVILNALRNPMKSLSDVELIRPTGDVAVRRRFPDAVGEELGVTFQFVFARPPRSQGARPAPAETYGAVCQEFCSTYARRKARSKSWSRSGVTGWKRRSSEQACQRRRANSTPTQSERFSRLADGAKARDVAARSGRHPIERRRACLRDTSTSRTSPRWSTPSRNWPEEESPAEIAEVLGSP